MSDTLSCYLVTKDASGNLAASVAQRSLDDLPAGEVLIRVAYSSLNFKDALSAAGHPGVTRKFPHVPGIDAAGTVVKSSSDRVRVGDEVIVTGNDLGQNTWGGFATHIRVPADWTLPLPNGLSAREAMIFGTAGLTAALCVNQLQRHDVPRDGEVVVTGATGGVGSIAVAILAKAGYTAVASTGKAESHAFLRELGASKIVGREEVDDTSGKPILAERWAGAVDTVGGTTLAAIVKSLKRDGCATACGLVGGIDLPLSVYPFILRGAVLVGIDSVYCPRATREAMWQKLAGPWRPKNLDTIATEEVGLDEVGDAIERIRAGKIVGRVLVRP
jgi:putative YhdH/YhfP family quinone oxidoreductase